MNTPGVLTRTTLVALAIIMAGCEGDGPTLPELGGDAEAQAAAALDQGATQAEVVMEASVSDMPEGLLPAGRRHGRPDSTSTRPDSVRQRPDSVGHRPDGRGRPDRSRRAELAVELGAEAIALAEELIGADATADENRHLEHAKALQRRAEAALEAGREAAAVQLAQAAQLAALKAVVLPDGVTEEEVARIAAFAEDLLEQARAAVGGDASAVQQHLLALAERFFAAGSEQVVQGAIRGIVALWKSATLSSFLIAG